jgi:hypothetical protein
MERDILVFHPPLIFDIFVEVKCLEMEVGELQLFWIEGHLKKTRSTLSESLSTP